MEKHHFEDYLIGEVLISPARTMTEADIHAFAALTGDWHPLHTDKIYAATTDYGERIAHGALVLSLALALGSRLGQYAVLPKSFIASYGFDEVRFTGPVKIGDTIRLESEVSDLAPRGEGRGLVTSRGRVLNQRSETVCSYLMKFLCGRRPS